jgi:hypothetical protein
LIGSHSPSHLVAFSGPSEVVAGLVAEGDKVHWVLLAIFHHLSIGVSDREPDLQALKLVRRLGSVTTRSRILEGGLLSKRARSCSLGKLLQVSGGSSTRARATSLLVLFGTPLSSFMSHCLQERIENSCENKIGVLETRYKRLMKNP